MTLVNSPLGSQQFPWASWRFGNRSIVLHGLKGAHNPFWGYARDRAGAAFEPTRRVCATCAEMGWSTWPGSAVNAWRCCGAAVPRSSSASRGAARARRRATKHRGGGGN